MPNRRKKNGPIWSMPNKVPIPVDHFDTVSYFVIYFSTSPHIHPQSVAYSTVGCRRTCCRRTARLQFSDFLGTCQARKLKIRTVRIIVRKSCTLCCIEGHHLLADKNGNRLESRKLRTAPGYDTGPHVLRHPTVLYVLPPSNEFFELYTPAVYSKFTKYIKQQKCSPTRIPKSQKGLLCQYC